MSTILPSTARRTLPLLRSIPSHHGIRARHSSSTAWAVVRTASNASSPVPSRHRRATAAASASSAGARNSRTVSEPPPSSASVSDTRGRYGLPGQRRHNSRNAGYAGSKGHTRAASRPRGERSPTAQSPTPHGVQPSLTISASASRWSTVSHARPSSGTRSMS
ncbi:hypothetical protein [Microbispora rosea]|uniref:hypothetical protein n=1 Tax=Microbispora rosea TaxID=58117 RepID=UPI003D94CB9A